MALLALLLGILGIAVFVNVLIRSERVLCDTCSGSGARACGAEKCERGTVPCSGTCLKKDSPGWEIRNIPGHPPGLLWLSFQNEDGSQGAVSQNHLGQTLELVRGRWTLGGACKICSGTGRMTCPACQARLPCPKCGGSKSVRKWF